MKPIAIIFSDHHLHDWNQFNIGGVRTKLGIKILRDIKKESLQLRVPALFLGDLLHTPKQVSNRLYGYTGELIEIFNGWDCYAISGNHDLDGLNTPEDLACSYIQSLSTFTDLVCVDFKSKPIANNIVIHGIPYLSYNIGFDEVLKSFKLESSKINLLMIHTNLYGAKNPDGFEVPVVENIPRDMDKYFQDFSLVLSGHIHKSQKLGKKIYMVGATSQQIISDMGNSFGYWLLYDNLKMQFKPIKASEFRYYDPEDGHPETDDYWIPMPKESEEVKDKDIEEDVFDRQSDKRKLAKAYCKVRGISSKGKVKSLIEVLTDDKATTN